MCDHCEGSSRRAFLGAVGVAGIAALSGCLAHPPTGVVEHLPGPILDEVPHGPIPSAINEKTIVVPPTPPQNQWIPTDTALGQILPRSAWTTASPDSRHMMPMNGVKLITIHHSGDGKPFLGESIHDIARHLEMVRQFHRSAASMTSAITSPSTASAASGNSAGSNMKASTSAPAAAASAGTNTTSASSCWGTSICRPCRMCSKRR